MLPICHLLKASSAATPAWLGREQAPSNPVLLPSKEPVASAVPKYCSSPGGPGLSRPNGRFDFRLPSRQTKHRYAVRDRGSWYAGAASLAWQSTTQPTVNRLDVSRQVLHHDRPAPITCVHEGRTHRLQRRNRRRHRPNYVDHLGSPGTCQKGIQGALVVGKVSTGWCQNSSKSRNVGFDRGSRAELKKVRIPACPRNHLNSNEIGWVGNDRSLIAAQKRGEALWPPVDIDPSHPTGVAKDFPLPNQR